jgi:hypothetical protein
MPRGNFGTMGRLVADGPLQVTPYKLKGGMFGGAFPSDGAELLKKLGIEGTAESLGKISFSVDVGNIQGGQPLDQLNKPAPKPGEEKEEKS